jgi:hypothetical protein
VIHVCKGKLSGPKRLDDRAVDTITAFLFHRGGHDDPARLAPNAGMSFQGSIILGQGFTFDDTDTKGVATPLDEMRRLIEANSHNQQAVFPYIGGEEVNTSPTHAHHRYVINFGALSEGEARREWPDLMAIVEAKVKPERTRMDSGERFVLREPLPTRWWQYADKRPALTRALQSVSRALVIPQTGSALAFAFLPSRAVFAHTLIVFPLDSMAMFCVLQSRAHLLWVGFLSATMGDQPRYIPSDCFETFPFPEQWETHPSLEGAGSVYYAFRAELMIQNDEGLTKTYNRFNDPDERDIEIAKLRDLHAAMDRAVLDAYGWTDIQTECEFLVDYEIDDEERGNKKKPYRYRWPDDVRDEVLARLLQLNAERANLAPLAASAGRRVVRRRVDSSDAPKLF